MEARSCFDVQITLGYRGKRLFEPISSWFPLRIAGVLSAVGVETTPTILKLQKLIKPSSSGGKGEGGEEE